MAKKQFPKLAQRLYSSPSDETPMLPNKEMTKPCEVNDETSTDPFPYFQCLTLQCDPSTLNHSTDDNGDKILLIDT